MCVLIVNACVQYMLLKGGGIGININCKTVKHISSHYIFITVMCRFFYIYFRVLKNFTYLYLFINIVLVIVITLLLL